MTLEAPFSTESPAYSYAGVVEALLLEVPEGEGLPQEWLIDQIGVVGQLEPACQAARAELSALLLAEMEVTLPTRGAFLAAAGEVGLARGMSSSAGARTSETEPWSGPPQQPDLRQPTTTPHPQTAVSPQGPGNANGS